MLEALGYVTLSAGDSAGALGILETHPEVRLLLTDVKLPGGLSGSELAKEAAQVLNGIRVLFMSGYTEDEITSRGRLDPGIALLQKPFHKADLAKRVHDVLQ